MPVKNSLIFLLLLTSTLVVPYGFSSVQAADQSIVTNQTNSTSTENLGLQISNFVHQAIIQFKEQRAQTIQAIKDCHQKMENATTANRTQIMDECHSTLNAIREKYHDERKQFQDLFKQFRENIITLRNDAEGFHVSDNDKENAVKNIDNDVKEHGMNGIGLALGHLKGMGENETRDNEGIKNINKTNSDSENESEHSSTQEDSNHGSHGPPSSIGEKGQHNKD